MAFATDGNHSSRSGAGLGAPASRACPYEWSARSSQGHLVKGQMQAFGQNQVRALLRRQGLRPVEVREVPRQRARAIKSQDIVLFTRQLATLLGAGVPLLQCLQIMARGQRNAQMAALIDRLRSDIEAGQAFSVALRRHPHCFSSLYVHQVEASEASGRLDVLLERLALDLEKSQALQAKVRSALVYPAVVLTVAVLVVTLILLAVVPSFQSAFASFGAELPWPTQVVLALSQILAAHAWWLTLVLVGLALWLHRAWHTSVSVRRRCERALLGLPLVGSLLHQAAVARWSRTLSGLLAAGLPLVEAMASVKGAAGFHAYEDACGRLEKELSQGTSFHAALGSVQLFSPLVVQMCAIGEESGALDHMLGKVAEFHERDVDERLGTLATLIEPVIIVLLGLVIGGLMLALYLPIFQMGQLA